jgi:hypothetical protein
MFPEREGGIAVEDDARRSLDEKRQEVAEDLRRDRDDAVGREQRAEHVRVAERIGDRQFGEDAGGQAEVDADREDMAAAYAAAPADDEFVVGQRRADRFDQGIGRRLAAAFRR